MKRGNQRRNSRKWETESPSRKSPPKRSGNPSRTDNRRLRATVGAWRLPEVYVPVRWINTLIGIFLLPIAGLLTQTFFTALSRETISHGLWASEEFWFFGLGSILWLMVFFGLPRPLVIYVFGHELTHAIWVWLMGGRVTAFKVSREGGHIITDKNNVMIALAPYFYPIYSMLLLVIYGIAAIFTDVTPYHRIFFVLLGASWAFHSSFTIWMIPKGQTDLTYYGTFYSLVIIYIMNLLVLSVMLVVAAPQISFLNFAQELLANTEDFSAWAWALLIRLRAR